MQIEIKTNQQAEILLRALRFEAARLRQQIAEFVLPEYGIDELKLQLDVVNGLIQQAKEGQ